jgi:hypothetical protein
MVPTRTLLMFFAIAAGILCGGSASAQYSYDPKAYADMANADSDQTIAPGTVITTRNWQQHKAFMNIGMQALFSGRYLWHLDDTPDFAMNVGPTISVPQPARYIADTEKYAAQVRLVRTESGGYTPSGYVAGLPFPHPVEPGAGYKVFYNGYYNYMPPEWVVTDSYGFNADRYRNMSKELALSSYYRLSHLSEPDMPVNPPYGKHYLLSTRYLLLEPEENRYTTEIGLYSDDPSQLQEIYLFLPSLRRSLRLSSSARCSPLLGSDYVQDDNANEFGIQASNFKMTLLGRKKVLTQLHENANAADSANFTTQGGFPSWPKPVVGKWEVRDVYVVDVFPLPAMGHYCYGHRVLFIDRQTWNIVASDLYDPQDKFWKTILLFWHPVKVPSGESVVLPLTGANIVADFQNSHMGLSPQYVIHTGDDVPLKYRDASVMAFPGSLSQVMQ